MKFYVLERSPQAVAGWVTVATRGSRADAERMCRGHRGRQVMTEKQYDQWHENNIMPFYRQPN